MQWCSKTKDAFRSVPIEYAERSGVPLGQLYEVATDSERKTSQPTLI